MTEFITLRNFKTNQELRLSMSEFSDRYMSLKEEGFRVTNSNNQLTPKEKYTRLANFTSVVNPKSLEVKEKFLQKGWSKDES